MDLVVTDLVTLDPRAIGRLCFTTVRVEIIGGDGFFEAGLAHSYSTEADG